MYNVSSQIFCNSEFYVFVKFLSLTKDLMIPISYILLWRFPVLFLLWKSLKSNNWIITTVSVYAIVKTIFNSGKNMFLFHQSFTWIIFKKKIRLSPTNYFCINNILCLCLLIQQNLFSSTKFFVWIFCIVFVVQW